MDQTQKKDGKASLGALARSLVRRGRFVPLGTYDAGAQAPFVSLAQTACLGDGTPLLLISRLALHTRHIEAAPRVSLLYEAQETPDSHKTVMNRARVSLQGKAEKLSGAARDAARARFTAQHPETAEYDTALDFTYYAVRPAGGRLVEGFGRIANLAAADLVYASEPAADLIAGEAAITAHMNEDHADAVALYAASLLGEPEGAWRMTGIDPEGTDLALDTETRRCFARLDFPAPVHGPLEARHMLVALAKQARGEG